MPRRVALISCVSKKLELGPDEKVAAKDLYISPLFKKAWMYATKVINPDKIYILSAEHHLLDPDRKISTYNKTLNNMNAAQRKLWALEVLKQMKAEGLDLADDEFFLLAGRNYYRYLLGEDGLQRTVSVYDGCKGIGHILHFLDENI